MPKMTNEQRKLHDNELIPVHIARKIAERLEYRAGQQKRTISDFLEILLEETREGSYHDVVLKIHQSITGKHQIWAQVSGNPNLLIEWLAAQQSVHLTAAGGSDSGENSESGGG